MKHAIVMAEAWEGYSRPASSPAISSESRLSNGTVSLESASNVAEFIKDGTLTDCLRAAGVLWMNYSWHIKYADCTRSVGGRHYQRITLVY